MFLDYKNQIDQILENTEKEEANNTPDKIAAVAMYKIMIGAISKFVEKESCSDQEFDAALSLNWKSAGRMLKYIWLKAEKMAITHGSVASCCLAEEAVYAWVREYYFLDDREAVMEERAKKVEAAQKQKEAKEKEAGYRKTALDILSRQGGWNDLPDEEKKKKLTAKIKSLRKKDSDKPAKTTVAAAAAHREPARDNAAPSETGGKTDKAPAESRNNSSGVHFTENSARQEIEFANTLDGQINLFNLI